MDAAGKPPEAAITYGHLIGTAVDFVIIALVVYPIGRAFMPKPAAKAAPTTKECPQCKEIIPISAARSPARSS